MEIADQEIQAMVTITSALKDLDGEAVARVIRWVAERHGIGTPTKRSGNGRKPGTQEEASEYGDTEYEDIAALFCAASPKTDAEKAAVGAYWFYTQGQSDFDSMQINKELKNLGHGVKNITGALDDLIRRKPQLVIQTRKSGNTKQARKKYRLTNEGALRVQRMLSGNAEADE